MPSRRVVLPLAGAVLLAIGLPAGAYALRDQPAPCAGRPLRITIAAAPDIAPALGVVAARFNVQPHEVTGRCVRVTVDARDPAQVAAYGRVAADVWVPDSSLWLDRARAAGLRPIVTGSIATTPMVLAVPSALAADLQARKVAVRWRLLHRMPRRTDVRALDPARYAAGLAATLVLRATGQDTVRHPRRAGPRRAKRQALPRRVAVLREPDAARLFRDFAGRPTARRSFVVAAEQAVVAYDQSHPSVPADVLLPAEGTMTLDHPFAALVIDPVRAQAVDAFRWALGTRQALDALQSHGFRPPDGRLDPAYSSRLGLEPGLPRLFPSPTAARITDALHAP